MAPNCGVPMNHLCSLSNSTQERPLARSDAPDRATCHWPVGLDLYVVKSLRWRGPIAAVVRGPLRFVIGMVALIGLLMARPDVALWLPDYIMGNG